MSRTRFRYALQPVLLTRQWQLDALLLDMNRIRQQLAEAESELRDIEEAGAHAASEWKERVSAGGLGIDTLPVVSGYLRGLSQQSALKKQRIAELERERDDLIERLTAARRAVDAVESHRDKEKSLFEKLRLSDECKAVDDQWTILQARTTHHDNCS